MPLIGTRGAASAQGFGEFAQQATAVQANAIDFDGSNDYLQRGDLTGNTDGQTFTFSFWVWAYGGFVYTADSTYFRVNISAGTVKVAAQNTAGTYILDATTVTTIPLQTWTNIIISVDLANAANRSIYINDVAASVTWTTYTNATIDFTRTTQQVAANTTPSYQGRLSNVYFDKTYRNLSVTANRRLFVTADLKPAAGQAALNPIMYLPMSDPTQPGLNQGTGGNFTLTGTIARSGRGPNQYNAPYSDLDGSTQYLSRTTALTGISDSKTVTMSFCMQLDATSSQTVFDLLDNTALRFRVSTSGSSGILVVTGRNSAGTDIVAFSASPASAVINRNYQIVFSFDLANASSRFVYINGQLATVTWTTYTNDTLDLATATPNIRIGTNSTGGLSVNGRLGAVWFNNTYIDLSVATNLAKFVTGTGIDAKPVDPGANGELPTGTSPLIYLPMYGNNAGQNKGTGGAFTVNSGPYPGARGPNEFWGNKADFDGTTGYLARTSALVGVSDGKVICGSFNFTPDATQTHQIFTIKESGGVGGLEIYVDNSGFLGFYGVLSTPTAVLNASSSAGVIPTIGDNYSVQYCIDLSDTAKRFVYVNGVAVTMVWSTYTNSNINLDQPRVTVGARYTSTGYGGFTNGKLAEFYFTTTYIDFSQEANRLLFRDAFGNPTDLPSAITAGTIPNPAVYMRFPPTSFGTNAGTGGDFTVNGTITDGGQL